MLASRGKKQHHGTVCKKCRKRRKKRDNSKLLPACSICLKGGITCDGRARRWPGVTSRGRLASRIIPVADANSKTDKPKEKLIGSTNIFTWILIQVPNPFIVLTLARLMMNQHLLKTTMSTAKDIALTTQGAMAKVLWIS